MKGPRDWRAAKTPARRPPYLRLVSFAGTIAPSCESRPSLDREASEEHEAWLDSLDLPPAGED